VRRLVLTHFYREVTEVDILARAGEVFEGPIVLAEDGMSIPFADIRETTRRRAES
jgi:ribonuclease BN (tRNA processing enzyme)